MNDLNRLIKTIAEETDVKIGFGCLEDRDAIGRIKEFEDAITDEDRIKGIKHQAECVEKGTFIRSEVACDRLIYDAARIIVDLQKEIKEKELHIKDKGKTINSILKESTRKNSEIRRLEDKLNNNNDRVVRVNDKLWKELKSTTEELNMLKNTNEFHRDINGNQNVIIANQKKIINKLRGIK